MITVQFLRGAVCRLVSATGILLWSSGLGAEISFVRTPNEGIQPQVAVDRSGTLHLIYYKGEAGGGDVFYVRQESGSTNFSKPIRVNSQAGSAIAAGTIRGAQIAVGRNGRVHVVWNGGKGAKKATVNGKEVTPMLYTRKNDAGTGFEPERNLITDAAGLDGGGSVAADDAGNVYVTWHGAPNEYKGEQGRAAYIAISRDDGAVFAAEKRAVGQSTGACGCCGMRVHAREDGSVYILYRAAKTVLNRDETLLVSQDRGETFRVETSHPWIVNKCPMSMSSFGSGKTRTLAAWETGGKVFFATIDPKTGTLSTPATPSGSIPRRHPSIAGNESGEVLLAWSEGTGWAKGGSLGWQVFDAAGKPTMQTGKRDGIAVWSLPAAASRGKEFVVIY